MCMTRLEFEGLWGMMIFCFRKIVLNYTLDHVTYIDNDIFVLFPKKFISVTWNWNFCLLCVNFIEIMKPSNSRQFSLIPNLKSLPDQKVVTIVLSRTQTILKISCCRIDHRGAGVNFLPPYWNQKYQNYHAKKNQLKLVTVSIVHILIKYLVVA